MSELRNLPKVDVLAASPSLQSYSPAVRAKAARAAVSLLREQAKRGNEVDLTQAESLAAQEAARIGGSSLKRVINASGVVLHTGIGRARLAEAAAKRLAEVAASHTATEIVLDTGERGDRQDHVRELLLELSGAEAALVVNNCAAAVFLMLAAHCQGREVILSRGEMVEIGGSFRMPDIVRQSGCRLVEVGCTNKTRLGDYERALSPETAAILRCHPSNFKIVGFAETPASAELKALAAEHGKLFLHDLGNGCLWDTSAFGLPREHTIQQAVAEGADVITASADKMLGGPQAGIVLGAKEAVGAMARHPLARALRVDKLTLAALEATLRLHAEKRQDEIPVYRYLTRSADEVKSFAQRIAKAYPGKSAVEPGFTEVGGGSIPGEGVPTWRVGLEAENPEELARQLRRNDPAILGRIERNRVWLDPRTVEPSEAKEIADALRGMGAA
jgi:L-seryl-tRNA(Ser) seleniumtransferase